MIAIDRNERMCSRRAFAALRAVDVVDAGEPDLYEVTAVVGPDGPAYIVLARAVIDMCDGAERGPAYLACTGVEVEEIRPLDSNTGEDGAALPLTDAQRQEIAVAVWNSIAGTGEADARAGGAA